MAVEIDLEHVDLDVDEEGPDEPETSVFVSIVTADGMRYCGTVNVVGAPDPGTLAQMVRRAAVGAASAHSPDVGRLVRTIFLHEELT